MEEIRTLAITQKFSDLNEQERIMVLSVMTKDDYEQLHLLLRSVRSLDADVMPPLNLATRLQEQMARNANQTPEKLFLVRLLDLKIPVWQAAATLLLVLAAMQFLKTPVTTPPAIPSVVHTVVKKDTVLLEKIQWKERIVWREKPAGLPYTSTAVPPLESSIEDMDQAFAPKINTAPQEMMEESTKKGMPMSEQPELLQFFTQPGESGRRF